MDPRRRASDESGTLDPTLHQGCYGEDLIKLVATAAGFACEKPPDLGDGIDLVLSRTHKDSAVLRPPKVELQVKTVRNPAIVNHGVEISYDLEVQHYNALRGLGGTSRYLVLVTVPSDDPGHWIGTGKDFYVFHQAAYWRDLTFAPETTNVSKVAVRVPMSQKYTRDTVHQHMREANERMVKIFMGAGGGGAI